MVSWWPGDGDATDIANGNDGTLFGGTTFAPGIVGQAFSFDGIDDGINISDSENLKITGSLTIEAWIFIVSFPVSLHGQILFRGDDRGALDPYHLSIEPDGKVRFHIEEFLTGFLNLGTPVTTGQFVHVAATLDGDMGAMRLYIDGVLAAETITSVRPFRDLDPLANPGIGIGNHGGYPISPHNQPFHGLIDELGIYARALSPGEIWSIFNAGSAGKCKEDCTNGIDDDDELVDCDDPDCTCCDSTNYSKGTSSIIFKGGTKDKAILRMCVNQDFCDALKAGVEELTLRLDDCNEITIPGNKLKADKKKTKFSASSSTYTLKIDCIKGEFTLKLKNANLSCASNLVKTCISIKDGPCMCAEDEFTEQRDRKDNLKKLFLKVVGACTP